MSRRIPRRAASAIALAALATLALAATALGAFQGNELTRGSLVLIGADDDNTSNPTIQPPGVNANQSLRNGDFQQGGQGADVLIGRLGPDVQIAGKGDDVLVGGTEGGSDVTAFPPIDFADGGLGNDVAIWAPGDGSDAFIGGEPPRFEKVLKTKRVRTRSGKLRKVKRLVKVQSKPDTDVLVMGTLLLGSGDNTKPNLFDTSFGKLPKANVSDRGLPAQNGDSPPRNIAKGFCEIVDAPAGSNYDALVRFLGDNGAQAVTIRVRGVEQVLCGNRNAEGITQFDLGADGNAAPRVVTTNFEPRAGSKLDALVD
jgi:hypothetical protein